jgi:cell division protein FtsL
MLSNMSTKFKGGPQSVDFCESIENVNEKINQLEQKLAKTNSIKTNIESQVRQLKRECKTVPILGKRAAEKQPPKVRLFSNKIAFD